MKNKRTGNLFLDVLTAFILFDFILAFAVVATLNFRPLYYMDIGALDIVERSGFSEEKIRENYDVLIDYNSMFYEGELEFVSLPMSDTGKIHFEEVKVIFVLFQKMLLFGGISGLVLGGYLLRKRSYRFLKLTGIFTLVIPLVLGTAIAANWDKAFVVFHNIAFDNDYWIFDAVTDPVITMLPDTFFLHCAVMILALVLIGAIGSLVIYKKLAGKD